MRSDFTPRQLLALTTSTQYTPVTWRQPWRCEVRPEHEGVLPHERGPCAEWWVAFGSRARCLLVVVVLAVAAGRATEAQSRRAACHRRRGATCRSSCTATANPWPSKKLRALAPAAAAPVVNRCPKLYCRGLGHAHAAGSIFQSGAGNEANMLRSSPCGLWRN